MASPSTVITLGYGSFGSINLIPTLGYGIGAAVVAVLSEVQVKPVVDHERSLSVQTPSRIGYVAGKHRTAQVEF